ncbi:TPA: sugar-binding transcriptional regulator [Streptococcus suis]
MSKVYLIEKVAYLYYIKNLKQSEIAERLNLDRSSISRYLKQARDLGLISINFISENLEKLHLEQEIAEKYDLKVVHIIDTSDQPNYAKQSYFFQKAASFVNSELGKHQTIGLAWGTTMAKLIEALNIKRQLGAEVVPLVGGSGHHRLNHHINELVYNLSRQIEGKPYYMQAQVVESDVAVKKKVELDTAFETIREKWATLDMVVTAIGSMNSWSQWRHMLSEEDLDEIVAFEAVGDLCGRFFDSEGDELKTTVNRRTVAIPLDLLEKVPTVITILPSKKRLPALLALLKKDYITHLVLDNASALLLLEK